MLKLTKRYRTTYTGEDIIVERTLDKGTWSQITETVPNAVINSQISNQAVVLGNGTSRLDMDLRPIKNHRGGLLGSKALQTYGCNALYRDFTPNFLVASGNDIVNEIASTSYPTDNIVYTSSLNMLAHPNKFYLVPHDPYADAGTTAAYIACFDGHKKIFLLGFDGQEPANYNNNIYADTNAYDSKTTQVNPNKWHANMKQLMQVYNDVDFVLVHKYKGYSIPTAWNGITNLRQLNHREFIIEADL
jgi:hypothetical protein